MTFELGRKIIKWKITKINVEKIACDFHKVAHFVCATTSPTYYMLILYEKILYTNTFSSLGFYIFFFFSAFLAAVLRKTRFSLACLKVSSFCCQNTYAYALADYICRYHTYIRLCVCGSG